MHRLLDVLASGVHDTKNQLFYAESQIAEAEAKHGIDLSEARYAIETAAVRLTRTLTAYHLLRNDATLAVVPVVVADLCDEVVLDQRRHLAHAGITLTHTCSVQDEWPLDRDLITDVLNNAERYLDVLGPEGEQFFLSKDMVHRVAAADPPKASLNLNRRSSDQSGFNPWAVLGVTREASADDIRAAWLALVKMYHRDRFANLEMPQEMKDYAAAMLARINVAHDQLAASVTPK